MKTKKTYHVRNKVTLDTVTEDLATGDLYNTNFLFHPNGNVSFDIQPLISGASRTNEKKQQNKRG